MYMANTSVHMYKKSLGVVVNISMDNFAVTIKLDSIWLVAKLIKEQLIASVSVRREMSPSST